MMTMKMKTLVPVFILASTPALVLSLFGTLNTKTYNPKTKSMFPVSSTLISGTEVAIQMDAQFTLPDGEKVTQIIKKSKKNLELVIISCGDPDYYFGLQSIVKDYPNVKIVASAEVVERIRQTKDAKLADYAPKLKNKAPTKLYVPEITNTTIFTIDGLQIILLHQENYAAFYWFPVQKVILGGVGISWNIHVFTADTQTPEIRASWREVLREMIELKPNRVIPGHYLGKRPRGAKAIRFTLEYLETYEKVLMKNHYRNSTAVINEMKAEYPNLGLESSLELGAKVNTGEMEFS